MSIEDIDGLKQVSVAIVDKSELMQSLTAKVQRAINIRFHIHRTKDTWGLKIFVNMIPPMQCTDQLRTSTSLNFGLQNYAQFLTFQI